MLKIKLSVCNPSISLLYHHTNRMNFEIRSSMFPQTGLSYRLHSSQASTLIPAIRVSMQKLTFVSGCTKEENLSGVGSDSSFLKHSVPVLPNLNMLWFIWTVVSSLLWLTVTLRRELNELNKNKKEPYKVSFDSLVGVDVAKHEFQSILAILRPKSQYNKLGLELPHGVLVYGPPGTGKTVLVHAMAREAGVSFFPISARDIGYHLDDTKPLTITSLFKDARRNSPSIIFIDSIDVIASECGTNEYNPILTELHDEMDRCKYDGSTVFVIVATNKPEKVDPFLWSSGMFFKKVLMDKPDEECRRKIVGLYLNKFLFEEDKEAICNFVTYQTCGLVGRDIESIAKDSYMLSVWRGFDHVTMDNVVQALEKFKEKRSLGKRINKSGTQSVGSMAFESRN